VHVETAAVFDAPGARTTARRESRSIHRSIPALRFTFEVTR